MILHKADILAYWLDEPEITIPEPGYIIFGRIPFPSLADLSLEEKALLRPLLEKHREWLDYEIVCSRVIN